MDILDTRDLNKRLNELEDEREDLEDAITILKDEAKDCDADLDDEYSDLIVDAIEALKEWDDEYKEELDELYAMRNEIPEWQNGTGLIAEEDFAEYAEGLADLSGTQIQQWPFNHIDWEAAADELQSDYLLIDYQGITYLYRS